MTKNSPMWDSCGLMPSADRPSDSVCSYSSVHDTLSAKSKSYLDKYKQHVLDYAIEWEKVVRTRVDAGLKKAEEMRRELDHYQKKVESLRLSTNQAMAKGKSVKPETKERLKRNEEKLISAKQNYNKLATDLCILMEEIAERSWRDLHPMLVKAAQFDMTLSGDEAKILSNLNQVVSQLKQVATQNGLSPQPRLKDLAGLKPELLSTRPGGVSGLTIEAGLSPTSSGSFSPTGGTSTTPTFGSGPFDPMAQPPGTVAPQGMGGFPVQISEPSSTPANQYSRSSSINSYTSAPAPSTEPLSTLSMLTISQSSAPAPTLDDVYSANQNALTIQSAPTSGNLPPLRPGGPNYRSSSFNDADSYSGYSNISGPPMSAPPPPPSMPPPPPPSDYYQSGYSAPAPGYAAPAPYPGAPPPMSGYPTQQSYTPDASSYSSPWTSNASNPTNPFGAGQAQSTNPFDG